VRVDIAVSVASSAVWVSIDQRRSVAGHMYTCSGRATVSHALRKFTEVTNRAARACGQR